MNWWKGKSWVLSLLLLLVSVEAQGQIAGSARRIFRVAAAPAACSEGAIYYNTTDNKTYVCTATDTWTELGGGGTFNGGTITGDVDISGGLLRLPSFAAPLAADCDDAAEYGRIAYDTNATSGQRLYVCESTGWVLHSGAAGSFTGGNVTNPVFLPAGSVTGNGDTAAVVPALSFTGDTNTGWASIGSDFTVFGSNGLLHHYMGPNTIDYASPVVFRWLNSAGSDYNLTMGVPANGVMEIRDGTTSTELRVDNTWTNSTTWEGIRLYYESNVAKIASSAGGGGSSQTRPLWIGTTNTADVGFMYGATVRWGMNGTTLYPNADNSYDLGSASNSVRTGYFDTEVVTPSIDSGGATDLLLQYNNTSKVQIRSGDIVMRDDVTFSANNTYDIGAASGADPRIVYVGTSVVSPLYDRPEPTATTGASQAGRPISITASDAVASTDTAGAAAGGAVTITAGSAARNTSGNADGGTITLDSGEGIGTGVQGGVLLNDNGSVTKTALGFGSILYGFYRGGNAGNGIAIGLNGTSRLLLADNNISGTVLDSAWWLGWGTPSNGTSLERLYHHANGVIKLTGATGSGYVRSFMGGGASVASATALPLPTGRVFHVTGTTTITSITSTNYESGVVITLIFDDVLTLTDGSNLKLAGDFVTTADDTITLTYDGTNWYETSRSVN